MLTVVLSRVATAASDWWTTQFAAGRKLYPAGLIAPWPVPRVPIVPTAVEVANDVELGTIKLVPWQGQPQVLLDLRLNDLSELKVEESLCQF